MNERPMRMWLNRLEEPKLVFAGENFHHDPKIALMKWGPFGFDGSEKIIKLGLVCPKSELESVRQWFRRLETPLIDSVQNVLKFPNFPGLSKTLRCKFEIPDNCVRILPERDLGFALAATGVQQFDSLLDLYSDSIQTLFGDSRPDVVLVCFPEEVADLRIQNQRISGMELGWMRKRQKEDDASQLSLFETSSEQDASAAAEIFPQAEELLFRNFHRALKAKCMMLSNAVPLQILRQHPILCRVERQRGNCRRSCCPSL